MHLIEKVNGSLILTELLAQFEKSEEKGIKVEILKALAITLRL